MPVVINPKNVTVTPRALTYLDKKVLPGPLSGISQMRLVTLMLYTLGCEYTNLHGQRIIDNEAHYALAGMEPNRLGDAVIVELNAQRFLAIRFRSPFSRQKSYTIDFDGRYPIVVEAG